MIGWKVVTKHIDGKLTSAIIRPASPWCATYVFGKPTTGRDGTPVLAFRTRQQARQFAAGGQLVLKAELDNPRSQGWVATYYAPQSFGRFWRSKNQNRYSRAPSETLACDAITLLERA